jgi:hypothetical protein
MVSANPLSSSYLPSSIREQRPAFRRVKEENSSTPQIKKEAFTLDLDRSKKLEEIKKKVSEGYYTSKPVTDDITDKLGHLLDEIT